MHSPGSRVSNSVVVVDKSHKSTRSATLKPDQNTFSSTRTTSQGNTPGISICYSDRKMIVNGHSSASEKYMESPIAEKRPSVIDFAPPLLEEKVQQNRKCGCCSNCSKSITDFIERCFFSFGSFIGKRPWLTIILSVSLCFICSAGNVFWQTNTDNESLWTPFGSPFIKQRNWILSNFPKDTRYESVLISSNVGNVLTASTVRYLLELHQAVENITSNFNDSYEDLCLKTPSDSEDECATSSLLGLWNYDVDVIEALTDVDVLEAVSSALSKKEKSSDPLEQIDGILSGLKYNVTTGKVVGAHALLNIWLLKQNGTKDGELGELMDPIAMEWEKAFIEEIIVKRVKGIPEGLTLDALAERSYDDGIDDAVQSNFKVMFGGFSLIFFYIAVTLGRWNALEQRVLLALLGILVIAMSLGASFGFCFYMGLYFADMHPTIPFLLLGIGVDDMYVIVQAVDNLAKEDAGLPLHVRIGKAMQHAGVSITVTSITDMAAFLIGSTSSMPILRAFCLFAAMGVLFLYVFAITFFVGCLTLDERRIAARKVCNFDCLPAKPEDWKPSSFMSRDPGKQFFGKVVVIIGTLVLFAFGVNGVFNIKLDYDSIWFMDQKSYQTKYYKSLHDNFPEQGERVEVYVGQIPYWNMSEEMFAMEKVLNSSAYINKDSIQFWYPTFYQEACVEPIKDVYRDQMNFLSDSSCDDELGFKRKLLLFLKENQYYFHDLRFNISFDEMSEEEAFDHYYNGDFSVTASRAKFQHNELKNTSIKTKAMDEVKAGLSHIAFHLSSDQDHDTFLDSPVAYSFMYVQWEANDIISDELIRNLSLTFATIAIVSLILIIDLRVCGLVFLSVVFSVTNVCGYAHYMGLTIEIVTSIQLILSVGLALDYAAHVGVIFSCQKFGTREEKMGIALEEIGTAVLNGGLSTFLAFVLLAFSDSYVFTTFFKMFGMVVLFGLFHGLIFLPVMLSLIGPNSAPLSNKAQNNQQHAEACKLNEHSSPTNNGSVNLVSPSHPPVLAAK